MKLQRGIRDAVVVPEDVSSLGDDAERLYKTMVVFKLKGEEFVPSSKYLGLDMKLGRMKQLHKQLLPILQRNDQPQLDYSLINPLRQVDELSALSYKWQ